MGFNNYKNLWFDAMCIEENKAWIFANNFNALFELNLLTKELLYLGSVPDEDMFTKGLYWNVVKVCDKLILIPSLAKNIGIFDLKLKKFSSIPIEMRGCKCFGAATYKNKIFLVGYNSARLVSVDVNEWSIEYILECEEYFAKKQIKNDRFYFRKNSCVVNNYFYIASCISNTVVKLNMETNEVEFIDIDIQADGLRNISFDGNNFWITKWGEGSLVKWNEIENVIEDMEIQSGIKTSSEIISYKDDILIFPTLGEHVIGFNKKTCQSYVVDQFEGYIKENNEYPWGNQKFTSVIAKNNTVYCFSVDEMAILKFDRDDGTIEVIHLDISGIGIEKKLFEAIKIVYENPEFSLEFFINGGLK